MITVVDASAVVDALIPSRHRDAALDALAGSELWAPGILDLEVASALHRLERTARISGVEADQAIDDLRRLPVTRIPADELMGAAWQLRASIRIADALYITAALALGGRLLTSDARLSRAPSLGVTVTLLR